MVREAQFLHRGGIVEYIELLCRDKTLLHPEVPGFHASGTLPIAAAATPSSATSISSSVSSVALMSCGDWLAKSLISVIFALFVASWQ